jgi:hypothetical protein
MIIRFTRRRIDVIRDKALQAMERKVLRSFHQDGLLDLFLGLILAQFATTPILYQRGMGDSWYYGVWLTVYTAAVLGMDWAKRNIVGPRLGRVTFSREQKGKSRRLTGFAVILSLLLFAAGLAAAWRGSIGPPELTFPVIQALGLLLGFSLLGAMTHTVRFYFYGIWIAASSSAGEVLYRHSIVPYHGYPLFFGTSSLALIGIGAFLFVRFLRTYPR